MGNTRISAEEKTQGSRTLRNHLQPQRSEASKAVAAQRVLYIGPAADEVCNIAAPHVGRVDISYESTVQDALVQARQRHFDVVLIDQRDESLATRLIVPVLASLGYPLKLVVISPLSDVSHYLSIPGVARVLSAPVREAQLLRVLGVERRARDVELRSDVKPVADSGKQIDIKRNSIVQVVSDQLMGIVSTLYKRAAFVLLLTMFTAFAFYGLLIGFFLLSSSWAAPLTLTRGHELVNKVEREITELEVSINLTEQRLQEAKLGKSTATQELADARTLVTYSIGTVKKEISARKRQSKVLVQNIKRLKKVRGALEAQLASDGQSADLKKLYSKRLIDKTSFNSGALSLIEASQRLATLESQIEFSESELEDLASTNELLQSLLAALERGGSVQGLTASASDLLLLTQQAVDAVSAVENSQARYKNFEQNGIVLNRSKLVLAAQLDNLQSSALARAIDKRIDVLFVPYGNERGFSEGDPLYTCRLTVIFCSNAGQVGRPLPGEISSVHPFFGKPIRGNFFEVTLDDKGAAAREIIHGSRKPFFF